MGAPAVLINSIYYFLNLRSLLNVHSNLKWGIEHLRKYKFDSLSWTPIPSILDAAQVQQHDRKTKKYFKRVCTDTDCENTKVVKQNTKFISLQNFPQRIDIKSRTLKNKLKKYSDGKKN